METLRDKITLLFSVSALGSGMFAKCFVGIAFLYYYCADLFHLPAISFLLHISIHGMPHEVRVMRISDFWVMKDVLVDREYDIALTEEPCTIVDLGSNIGISALFFATRYPHAIVHAVEPNPELYAQLIKNTQVCKNIVVHALAIAGQNGTGELFVGESAAGSSMVDHSAKDKKYSVATLTFDEFLRENKIESVDLLKFDIEGAEQYLIRDFSRKEIVGCYLGEMHYDLCECTPEEVCKAFSHFTVEEYALSKKDRTIIILKRV